MNFSNFFDFEKFLTPLLIRIVYWAGLLGIVLSVLSSFLVVDADGVNLALLLLGNVLLIIILCIFWRVLCEAFILSFKMYERMKEIAERLPRKNKK
jgi:Domain of unknown function (DUF4282)